MDSKSANFRSLSSAAGYSYECLRGFRERRIEAIREYVGSHYSDNGSDDRVPIPLIELALNIYTQRLVANTPRARASAKSDSLAEICDRFELALNDLITNEIDLGSELEDTVVDAIFAMGIIKIGLHAEETEYLGQVFTTGKPFAKRVSLDNWVHDVTATSFEECQFMGDRYVRLIDDVVRIYGEEAAEKVIERKNASDGNEKAKDVTERDGFAQDEYRPTCYLWDVWLPRERKVITCSDSGDPGDPFGEILAEINWEGPKHGPYRILRFSTVPDNLMPLPPVALWRDLHELANVLFRKLGRQAQREKSLLCYQKGAEKDADRIKNADDGEVIPVDSPERSGEKRWGGISQQTLASLIHVKDLFSYLAGNLDVLGGLGPQSETLGQDQLLSASASQRIQKMQKKVTIWVVGIIRDLGFYLWTDPAPGRTVIKRLPNNSDVSIPVSFGPNDRIGKFLDYNIDIVSYSMQYQSPEAKLMSLRVVFREFIAALLPMMAEQGIMLDVEKLMRVIAELGNLQELNEIFIYTNSRYGQEVYTGNPMKPAETTRRYERVNRPGATQPGKDQILMQALLGGRPQQSETASVFRPTS